jgi:hypothetical protein
MNSGVLSLILRKNSSGIVCGGIIDDQKLEIGDRLCKDAIDGGSDVLSSVSNHHHNTELHDQSSPATGAHYPATSKCASEKCCQSDTVADPLYGRLLPRPLSSRRYRRPELGGIVAQSVGRLLLEARRASSAIVTLAVLAAAAVPWSVGMLWTLGEPDFEPLRACVPRSGARLVETLRRRRGVGQQR